MVQFNVFIYHYFTCLNLYNFSFSRLWLLKLITKKIEIPMETYNCCIVLLSNKGLMPYEY
jgi:hypothetical protein